MVAKKLRYINGHFYDIETKERIELDDNIEVTLSTGAANFKNGEKVGKYSKLKSAVELNKVIMADPNIQECKKKSLTLERYCTLGLPIPFSMNLR